MNIIEIQDQKIEFVSVIEVLEKLPIKFSLGYLMNREKLGIPLRKALVEHLYAIDNSTLVINMAGVEEMTTSVAEEIGPILFQELIKRRLDRDVYLTYCNVSEEIATGLDGIFKLPKFENQINTRQNIVVFSTLQNEVFSGHQFLGQEIPTALKEILDVIYKFNVVSSSDLEEHGIKAASRKLTDLVKYYPWLFRKIQRALDIDSRAWAYFYSPIVPVLNSEAK
ncbi:MAG: hypothetical protein H7Y59_02970 [Anaerolineales bacterium]|nr:hypothetical protein [Anaerolineales bacterium]